MIQCTLDGRFDQIRRLRRIDHHNGIILGGQFEITNSGALEEAQLLQFDAIQLAAMAGALQAKGRIDIEIEGEIRLEVAEHRLLDGTDKLCIDATATTLIGLGGEIVAIPTTQTPSASAGLMRVSTSCTREAYISSSSASMVRHSSCTSLTMARIRSASGVPPGSRVHSNPVDTVVLQIVSDVTYGRALPCPFQTFNNNKFRHQDFFNMYSRTARLCSSRVLEK